MGDAARAATEEFIQLYRNVPATGPGVCRICHSGPNHASYEICDGCRDITNRTRLPTWNVVPISLCTKENDQLYDIVALAAQPAPRAGGPDRIRFIAATISRFYASHASCLRRLAGADFTLVDTVPCPRSADRASASRPLNRAVQMISGLRGLHRSVLRCDSGAEAVGWREPNERAYAVSERVAGETVLLLDGMFVTGAHLQSAASALHRAGAASVTALVVVRLINLSHNDANREIWARASAEPFSFDRCCLCDPA
ncbi:phosphoribosyltransferase [Streptosporangium sp. NPDC004379]|uniref:phosphoribosyltransferase n=1 Tax=Streptosporangium sp. NPDC004379 TaxID=3366189 RepID=UPI00367E27F6